MLTSPLATISDAQAGRSAIASYASKECGRAIQISEGRRDRCGVRSFWIIVVWRGRNNLWGWSRALKRWGRHPKEHTSQPAPHF